MTITMQKLLDLLYDYKPILQINTKYIYDNKSIWVKEYKYNGTSVFTRFDEIIISKKFGFIQWLVENDKIKEPLPQVLKDIDVVGNDTITGVDVYNTTDSLLMLLAIQEDPTEFLISVLK